jgi:hypothetical protein
MACEELLARPLPVMYAIVAGEGVSKKRTTLEGKPWPSLGPVQRRTGRWTQDKLS